MKIPLLLSPASRFVVICLTSALFVSSAFAEPPQKDKGPAATPATKTIENREMLLARITKVLNYGTEVGGYQKPGKVDAAVAMGLIGDERSVSVLADHLQNEENDQLRLQITRALIWIGGDKAVAALESALQDEYPHVRKLAAEGLKVLTRKVYEYDKAGLPDISARPGEDGAARLERIAQEVAKRREIRQATMGTAAPIGQKVTEPVDLELNRVSLELIAKVYSSLSGKIVVASPKLSGATVSCKIEKTTRAEALALLQKALLEAGVQDLELEHGLIALVPVPGVSPSTGPAK